MGRLMALRANITLGGEASVMFATKAKAYQSGALEGRLLASLNEAGKDSQKQTL